MKYRWQQKHNYQEDHHWRDVGSFNDLPAACKAVRNFKTQVAISGKRHSILQQRIIDDDNKTYSKFADERFD